MRFVALRALVWALLIGIPGLPAPGAAQVGVSGWRGDGTGRFPDADPPLRWSRERNVLWKVSLGGWSNAAPIAVGDRLFVPVEPFRLVCLDRRTGKRLWEAEHSYREVGFRSTNPSAHENTGYSSPTPVTDGSRVYALFGNGVAAAYDLEGKRQWIRVVDRPTLGYGHSASPVLVAGSLILPFANLIALDPGTGEERWKTRSSARYGGPVVATIGDEPVVITSAGEIVRAKDGVVLARELADLEYAAPVVEGGRVYFVGREATAYELPGEIRLERGRLQGLRRMWRTRLKRDRYFASPVVHEGRVYAVARSRVLTVLDAETGKKKNELRTGRGGGDVYASLAVAGGKLYVTGEAGKTAVFEPGDRPRLLAESSLARIRACPLFVGDSLYLRAGRDLYCVAD